MGGRSINSSVETSYWHVARRKPFSVVLRQCPTRRWSLHHSEESAGTDRTDTGDPAKSERRAMQTTTLNPPHV